MQTDQHDVFFSDSEDRPTVIRGAANQVEPPISFDRYIRSIASSVAMMIGAYFLWAQEFGNTGFAVFLIASAVLVVWNLMSVPKSGVCFQLANDTSQAGSLRHSTSRVLLLGIGLLLACLRLVWQPNALIFFAAILFWLAMALAMQAPKSGSWQLITFPFRSAANGVVRWIHLPWERIFNGMSKNRLAWLSWVVPLFVGILFLTPLIQAHPEIASGLLLRLSKLSSSILDYAKQMNTLAVLLVTLIGIWSLGVLLPRFAVDNASGATKPDGKTDAVCSSIAYSASRNTLVVVSAVFVWFLAVEIQSSCFRTFPDGFIYSTYCHQGAAWLVVALGMSTVAMSILFRPEMHQHPRIATLQRLAWFWSFCNVLLVIAVFYRLIIYVNFNGMTRMRVVGFVGVACVFVGFIVVNSRILGQKSITSILHKQCWAFVWSIYLLALLPMDSISHGWNCSRIHAGHLAPAVQLAVQPISDEGLLCILPLIASDEAEIRDGVIALLAQRYAQTTINQHESPSLKTEPSIRWTQFQGSRYLLEQRFQEIVGQLQPFLDSTNQRQRATERFRVWTKRWY